MYTLLTRLAPRELLLRQAPLVFGSLAIAEMFYKFHSFLLETGAFLATWFMLDALVSGLLRTMSRQHSRGDAET
jgi:hypothetical protein